MSHSAAAPPPPQTSAHSNNLATSSPHLLKQLTSGINMTVSTAPNNSTEDIPPCKKLKLDIEAANAVTLNSGSGLNNSSSLPPPSSNAMNSTTNSSIRSAARRRLLEKRQARRERLMESYKDNMSELFFLQSKGNVVDLPAFRKRPSQQYLNFLKSNNAPNEVMDTARLAVLGPNALLLEKPQVTVSTTSGKVTVSSAAMAAAVVAVHGSNWRPITGGDASTSALTTSVKQPPYSPRSSLLSPVKFGDQLQPYPKPGSSTSIAPASSYASYRLPSYSRENLVDKIRQEAWVHRRINDLTREGLWSDKRLPKVCERPRPRTHWDSVQAEMQWLAVDFHEERQWKQAAARMLAHSAKQYVEERSERRARKAAAVEKRHRCIAKFMADQVEAFWQSLYIHSEKISSNDKTSDLSLAANAAGEASSESGVCNLDEETDTEEDDDDHEFLGFKAVSAVDDESTIEEQETFEESLENKEDEVTILEDDNNKPLEELMAHSYPGYNDLTEIEQGVLQADSSISSTADEDEEEDDDSDDYDFDFFPRMSSKAQRLQEGVITCPLSSRQRQLYDDYLSSSQSVLDSLDAESISNVLQTLRKICNHPQLLEDSRSSEVPEDSSLSMARVIDGIVIPSRVANATSYDPLVHIDLDSLNLVFFTHESTLTAITSDRIRKCCAPKALIQEVNSTSKEAPRIPRYNFNYGTEGWSLDSASKTAPSQSKSKEHKAFHADSINVIAKFNERRCHGMPLYGQDLIQVLTIVSPEATCSPPRMRTSKTTHWKGSGYVHDSTCSKSDLLPMEMSVNFWPFCQERKCSSKHLRSRWLRKSSVQVNVEAPSIHADLQLPPKVALLAGFNRTHLALTSKHLAVEEAVKFARSKAGQRMPSMGKARRPFEDTFEKAELRKFSSKLSKLDELLSQFRQCGERVLIFCQMPEMLGLLHKYLRSHQIPFLYLHPGADVKERLKTTEEFISRNNILALLTCQAGVANLTSCSRFNGFTNICNVVFFDFYNDNYNLVLEEADDDQVEADAETLEWCRSFNGINNLRVFKLVAENTVEDSLSIKALLQQKLAVSKTNNTTNGPICKIKKHALEALFKPQYHGDNGILHENKLKDTALEEILDDPEVLAQLDWLWSSKIQADGQSVTDLSKQVDKGCDADEDLKPIKKYAKEMLLPSLSLPSEYRYCLDDDDEETAKMEWEEAYQKELALLASELEDLERMEPQLCYSREDASRSWHGLDGQPMPLWTPPIPSITSAAAAETKLRVEEHLSYLYQIRLMEEIDLPPVYVKKELLKRQGAVDAANEMDKHKMRKEDGYPSMAQGGAFAPRSLFDRHPAFQKQKIKAQQKRIPLGSGSYVHGPLPPNFQQQTGLPRHPIPRQQVEAENQPEWLIQEDWALLHTIKDVQGLPLSLNTMSPAHTVNWDLVSDMVNAVSRVYRGPRQCKHRFDTIIAPREEGRILYDMPNPSSLASSSLNSKKNKKNANKPTNPLKLNNPGKINKPMKTSQIFSLDKNNSWSSLFANRFETIKAVANKRSPTTKPLVVNPAQKNTKHAAVLAECGITYESPLNPIQVAANRADRIQKEKQKTAQEQAAAQINQQRVAAAQAAANAAQQSAAATARVAIVQQQQNAPNQQAVVVGIPAQQGQAVRQVISQQSVQELVRSQHNVVPGNQQPTVVVTSHPPIVSVGSLTPSQLQQTLKQAGVKPTVQAGSSPIGVNRSLTPAQINILKQQQALLKKNATEKARLQASLAGGTAVAVAATTASGQKVSIAVTPSGVSLATLANSMPVTVVTQALGSGQAKTHLIRGVPGAKGNLKLSEHDMKLFLGASKQQLQQQQKVAVSSASGVTQLLQGIQSGAQQVTTLVKSSQATTQSVTIPVQMQSVQGIKTIRQSQHQPTMVQLRHQLVQGNPRSKIIPQGGQTILATAGGQTGQKVALSQVAASGAKGVPAQLIVSSGNSQKPVTVQQIHQIKGGQAGQGQQLIPHNLLKTGPNATVTTGQAQGTTVQARVIPATVAGRPQQIHVVAAPASAQAVANAPGQRTSAPNVTVDASGRPVGTLAAAAGGASNQIRVAAGSSQHQLLNQVLGVRPASSVISPTTTKLQVVHASNSPASATSANQQQSDQQQNG